ncbi:MAG: putative major facilitator superfamily transporter [Ilumatobacteraceae bacterium]|nr:putative major facilitator superfamily transporter [Ilumatobacteraceae bacterium]
MNSTNTGPVSTSPVSTSTAKPGTARAALGYRDFRFIWIGLFASQIGTWMQNLALPAYIDARTHSATWVAVIGFAQLGPLLVLSIPAGVLADRVPRKPWLIGTQSAQLVLSIGIAVLLARDASLWSIFAIQLAIGTFNALGAPAMQASIPLLVSREDLPGALSLNSVMLNGSRVIGPALAAALIGFGVTVPQIFVINAGTYLFAVAGIALITIPHEPTRIIEKGIQKVLGGLRIAKNRSVLSRMLISMTVLSFFCLPFIALFPSIARLTFGIDSEGSTYKWLYATWGLGACLGALACGSVLLRFDRRKLIVNSFRGFAATMAVFALARGPGLAIPVGFLLGFFYFTIVTPISIVFQVNMYPNERARVMSLWMMAFGGTVPIGGLAFGPVVDWIGPRPVLFIGVAAAIFLSWWCNLINRPAQLLPEEAARESLQPRHPAALDEQGVVAGE